jgi:maleate cis-trans isomerase
MERGVIIEKMIGIPVAPSNHATARAASGHYNEPLPQWGKLFALPLAD